MNEMSNTIMNVRDPLYGFISISKEEKTLINTPTFQRLRRINQLSNTYLVYPGANHTRLEHSLGVLHLARVLSKKLGINGEHEINIRKAALLHDIGHGPYSHVFETIMKWINGEDFSHENISKHIIEYDNYLSLIMSKYRDDVVDILFNKKNMFHNIISSDFDIDKMDYFRRDSYHLGVAYGLYDFDRLLLTSTIIVDPFTGDHFFGVTEKGMRAYESFRLARFNLWEQVYEHHTRLIADDMLIRAIRMAFSEGILNQEYLKLNEAEPEKFCKYYTYFDDHSIQHIIISKSKGKAKELVNDIRARKLYKRTYRTKIDNLIIPDAFKRNRFMKASYEVIKDFEKEIADSVNVNEDDIIVHIQSSPIKGYHSIKDDPELNEILLIKMDNGETHRLGEESPLTIEYKTIKRLYVFCKGDLELRKKIHTTCEDIFGCKSDYIPK